MPVLRDVGRHLDREIRIHRLPLVRLRGDGILRAVVVVLHLLVVLRLAAGERRLVAVERRELGGRKQPDRTVLLERLKTQVEVRRHTPQIHRAPYTLQQSVHRTGTEGHIHARAKRSRGLDRLLAHTAAHADLAQVALRHVGDENLHRNHRHGAVDLVQERFDTRHIAPVAAHHQTVLIGKGLHLDILFQGGGNQFVDLRHRTIGQRHHLDGRQRIALRRAEDIDAPFTIVAVRRTFEKHREQRVEIGVVDPDACRQVHRRLEIKVELQLFAKIENHILHISTGDVRRDAPQRVDTQFVGRELPPPGVGGTRDDALLRGRLFAVEAPDIRGVLLGLKTVDRREGLHGSVEGHGADIARDFIVVERLRDDDVAIREPSDLLHDVDQPLAAQVIAQRRVGGIVAHVGIGSRSSSGRRGEDRDDVAHRLHVETILAAQKTKQVVHASPREVARNGDVLHTADA